MGELIDHGRAGFLVVGLDGAVASVDLVDGLDRPSITAFGFLSEHLLA